MIIFLLFPFYFGYGKAKYELRKKENEMQPQLCTMKGDHRQYFLSNSAIKNQQFPFLLIRTETKPAEENLRIKNTTQRNLFDAESH